MSEHQQVNRQVTRREAEQVSEVADGTAPQQQDAGFDSLLDEIDSLLEGNAAEYVRSFVQKGGQ